MIRNKKGLSAIIVTLILILLAIVAVGVVWVVVNNVLKSSEGRVNLGAACLEIDIEAVSLVESAGGTGDDYDLTLSRSAGGDAIGGVKVVVFSDTVNSVVEEFGAVLAPLETKTQPLVDTTVTGANKVEITPYFTDASGNDQDCPTTITKEF